MAEDPYRTRLDIYKKIERTRRTRVIALVLGDRQGMQTQIAPDTVDLMADHLDAVFPARKISLILYTIGGSTTAAWNLVNMIRMFCDKLEIIVPARARS